MVDLPKGPWTHTHMVNDPPRDEPEWLPNHPSYISPHPPKHRNGWWERLKDRLRRKKKRSRVHHGDWNAMRRYCIDDVIATNLMYGLDRYEDRLLLGTATHDAVVEFFEQHLQDYKPHWRYEVTPVKMQPIVGVFDEPATPVLPVDWTKLLDELQANWKRTGLPTISSCLRRVNRRRTERKLTVRQV